MRTKHLSPENTPGSDAGNGHGPDPVPLAGGLAAALDSMSDAFYTLDTDWRFTFLNRQAALLLGRSAEGLLGKVIWTEFPATLRSPIEREYRGARRQGEAVAFEHFFAPLQKYFSIRAFPSRQGLAVYFTDITERRRADEALRENAVRIKRLNRMYAVLSQVNALIVRKSGRDELFREACRVAVELAGFRFAWVGMLEPGTGLLAPVASAGEAGDALHRAPTGGLAMDATGASVMIPLVVRGESIGMLALYAGDAGVPDAEEMRLLQELAGNISLAIENIETQERLDYLAYYDPLTGLANRTLFLDRVSQHVRGAAAAGRSLAVMLMDIERFKNINDSLGHAGGDAVLKQLAEWLAAHSGDANLLARVGSNHFAAVVPRIGSRADLSALIEGSLDALGNHAFDVQGGRVRISGKVGGAVFPDGGSSAEALFRNAEAALKHGKANGDRYLLHSSEMTDAVAGKLGLEARLRRALDEGEFVLHYQPKVDLASGRVTSAEALIRWNDPLDGLVQPGDFIPVLEETGLIHDVGRWAMGRAIADYLRWCDEGRAGVRLAVNVSSLQLRRGGFVAEVARELARDPRAASGLELEITESVVVGDIERAIASLQAIRARGVTVALDDFGTGFSSLTHLARLPIDTLKIDRSFIADLDDTPEGQAVVSMIITLAHSLRYKVVAEGVETPAQARLLRKLGCDEMQGYHFSAAVPAEVFAERYLGGAGPDGPDAAAGVASPGG